MRFHSVFCSAVRVETGRSSGLSFHQPSSFGNSIGMKDRTIRPEEGLFPRGIVRRRQRSSIPGRAERWFGNSDFSWLSTSTALGQRSSPAGLGDQTTRSRAEKAVRRGAFVFPIGPRRSMQSRGATILLFFPRRVESPKGSKSIPNCSIYEVAPLDPSIYLSQSTDPHRPKSITARAKNGYPQSPKRSIYLESSPYQLHPEYTNADSSSNQSVFYGFVES